MRKNVASAENLFTKNAPFSKEFPTLKREKAITKIKVDKNISFWESRQIVENEGKSSYSNTLKASLNEQHDENIKKLTEQNNRYLEKINQLEEKTILAESIKTNSDTQLESMLKQYKDESEKKFEKMEEQYEAMENKCDQLVSAYHEEKQRRKRAEKDPEKLQENYTKLENLLKLYGHKHTSKHRNQENLPSPSRKKKVDHKMKPANEVEYIDSESENSDEQIDNNMDQQS